MVAERYVSRHIYLRFTAAALWPGKGFSTTLPEPVSQPWTIVQAMVNFSF